MSLKILYIHGFGSTGNSQTVQGLQKALGNDATILAPQFSNDLSTVAQIKHNIAEAKKHKNEFRPNVVIGSSFGGFIATFLNGSPRILINPCLLPSERLHNLSPNMSKEDIELLKALENSHDIDWEMRFEMYGLFGLHDELFSYLNLFKKLYGESKTYTMPCGHRIDAENIENHLIPIIREVNKISESLTPEMFDGYCPDDI
ncbi:MAG: YqiA/YcfP family alpha/beta fold hydrolase [Paludibacter sp.]